MAGPAFDALEGGDDWRRSLPKRAVSENMMRWQKFYEDPCGYLCCFSPDCACIRCSNCRTSLTTLPPKRRFQCMECEVLPPESSFDSRPEYCEVCFSLAEVLHWHQQFLLVDEHGVHQAVKRLFGVAEMHYITQDDFPRKEGLSDDANACGICCIDFSLEDPGTCNVGCTAGHGEGVFDAKHGMVDSGMFYHADCRMSWMKAQKTDTYCGKLPVACKVCLFNADCKAWQRDFQRGITAIQEFYTANADAGDAKWEELTGFLQEEFQINLAVEPAASESDLQRAFQGALKELHPQPWLRRLIDEL